MLTPYKTHQREHSNSGPFDNEHLLSLGQAVTFDVNIPKNEDHK